MNRLDFLKLISQYEEFSESDFTPDELMALLEDFRAAEDAGMTFEAWKESYFQYYDDVKDKSLRKQDW